MSQSQQEKELVINCLQGNAASQKKLFEIYSAKMYAICLRYSPDREQAKDLLQEGFIRTFKKLEQFRFEGSFEGWMKRIFVTTALEYCRKEAKSPEETGLENYENLGEKESTLDRLNLQDLLETISTLPAGYRTVFNLFVIEGYSHQEIADELGISESTSKSQLHKARLQLISKINNRQ